MSLYETRVHKKSSRWLLYNTGFRKVPDAARRRFVSEHRRTTTIQHAK